MSRQTSILTLVWKIWANYAGNNGEYHTHPFCEWWNSLQLARRSASAHMHILWAVISLQMKPSFNRKSCHVQDASVLANKCVKPHAAGHYFLHVKWLEFLDTTNTARQILPFLAVLWHDEQNMPVSYKSQCNDFAGEASSLSCMSYTVLPGIKSQSSEFL
jgi:hypothetical protein